MLSIFTENVPWFSKMRLFMGIGMGNTVNGPRYIIELYYILEFISDQKLLLQLVNVFYWCVICFNGSIFCYGRIRMENLLIMTNCSL